MTKTMQRLAGAIVGAILATSLLVGGPAYAAQINAFLVPEYDKGYVKFMGFKFMRIQYPEGSPVDSIFDGVNDRFEFTVPLEPDLSEKDLLALEQINRALLDSNSPMQLVGANVTYSGTLRGSGDTLTLSYKVELDAEVSGYVLNQPSNASDQNAYLEKILVDSNWRGFVVDGPLLLDSGLSYGIVNVNQPIGLLQMTFPEFAQKLLDSNPETKAIMTEPILDFTDIGRMPLERWHVLFDPTFSQTSVKGMLSTDIGSAKVLSVYAFGECSIREGCPLPRNASSSADIDGTGLKVNISTPQSNAQLEIAGYTTIEGKSDGADLEVIGVSLHSPGPIAVPLFTMQVLMALGGLMGAVAIIVLLKTRK